MLKYNRRVNADPIWGINTITIKMQTNPQNYFKIVINAFYFIYAFLFVISITMFLYAEYFKPDLLIDQLILKERLNRVLILLAINAVLIFFIQSHFVKSSITNFFLSYFKRNDYKIDKTTINSLNNETEECLSETDKSTIDLVASRHLVFHEMLQRLISEEKIYNRKTLTQPYLANLMKTNVHYLSNFFNQHYKTTFSDYFNELRIKEACRIIREDAIRKYSIDQVADMVGFSSRSTFYPIFKKHTGVTPSFFQKTQGMLNSETIPDETGNLTD